LTNSELLEKILKDEIIYGSAYIKPPEGRIHPQDIALTEEELENDWVCIDGILKESYIWVKKT